MSRPDSSGHAARPIYRAPMRPRDRDAPRGVGIHNVRPATWLDRPFGDDEVPTAVVDTFARGGRNFQRTHDELAERETAALWDAYGPSG